MTASELLAELRRRQVNLAVDGKNLRYVAPKGALTDELCQAIKAHKLELLELLQTDTASQATSSDRREAAEVSTTDSPNIVIKLCPGCGGEVIHVDLSKPGSWVAPDIDKDILWHSACWKRAQLGKEPVSPKELLRLKRQYNEQLTRVLEAESETPMDADRILFEARRLSEIYHALLRAGFDIPDKKTFEPIPIEGTNT